MMNQQILQFNSYSEKNLIEVWKIENEFMVYTKIKDWIRDLHRYNIQYNLKHNKNARGIDFIIKKLEFLYEISKKKEWIKIINRGLKDERV